MAKSFGGIARRLVELYLRSDATLVEINPLVVTGGGRLETGDGRREAAEAAGDRRQATGKRTAGGGQRLLAIDAKMTFDDSALFRQAEVAAMADAADEDPAEGRAKKAGLSYVKLEGSIGCLVNGAGLAMATMDLIKLHGGEPANFLDVGGSADQEAVTEAFRIILSDAKVRGVLVNIFGGIMRCDVIAGAIVAAAKEVGFKVPLVVRLEGTNAEVAKRVLEEARPSCPHCGRRGVLTEAAAWGAQLAQALRSANSQRAS